MFKELDFISEQQFSSFIENVSMKKFVNEELIYTQLTFTCSKLITETVEKEGMKYVQSSVSFIVNYGYSLHFFLVFLLLTLNK